MDFLDLEGLKTFKSNCDGLYEKKSLVTNKADVVDVDFSKNRNQSFITMCRSSDTGNSTKKDGHIINLAWDNSTWGSQIFIQDGGDSHNDGKNRRSNFAYNLLILGHVVLVVKLQLRYPRHLGGYDKINVLDLLCRKRRGIKEDKNLWLSLTWMD